MSPIRTVGCLLVAAALAAGCSKSSSTGPQAVSVVGLWKVTWTNLPAGSTITPTSDTLTIVQTAGGYTVTYSQFSYKPSVGSSSPYAEVASGSSFAVSGDSVVWHVGDDITTGCYVAVDGTATSTTMQGTAKQSGAVTCPTDSWSWTAIKL